MKFPNFKIVNLFADTREQDVMSMLENFFSMCTALYDVRNTRQAAAILFLYVKTFYNESMLFTVKEYLLDCGLFTLDDLPISVCDGTHTHFEPEFEVQAGGEHWLQYLSKVRSDWGLVRKSPAFGKISNLISMCAALGLCNLSNFDFDLNGVRIFSVPAHHKHVNAFDFISACFDTVEYFITGGYECFKTGSFDPLLFEDSTAKEFEDNYVLLCEYSNHVKCGNLEKLTGMKENDYGVLLDEVIEKCKAYLRNMPNGYEKNRMFAIRDRLGKIRVDFISYRVSGKLREAPYGIYLHGKSSVGKSYVSALLQRIILMSNGFDASDDRFLVINEADKFLSTAKSSVNCVIIDDMGNTKPDYVEKSPAQKVIELVNNVPYYANMADVDQKGKVALEPKVVAITSNITLERVARQYSMDIMSITRRMLQIEQFARKEFCIPGTEMLDGPKVSRVFGKDPYPDVYTFNVRKSFNLDGRIEQNLVLPEHCSLKQLIEFIIEDSKGYFDNQAFVVSNSNNLAEKLTKCNGCSRPSAFCTCYHKDSDDVDLNMDDLHEFLDPESGSEMRMPRRDNVEMPADYQFVLKLFYYMPDCVFYNPISQFVQTLLQFNRFLRHLKDESTFYLLLLGIGCYIALLNIVLGFSIVFLTCYFFLIKCWLIHQEMQDLRANERNFMPSTLQVIRNDKLARVLGSCAMLAILWRVIKGLYQMYRINLDSQGSLSPTSEEEIAARDAEKNPWIGTYIDRVPQTLQVDCSQDQLKNVVDRNLMYLRFINEPEGVRTCNGIGVKGNSMMIPTHMFQADQDVVEFELYRAKAYNSYTQEYERKYVGTTKVCKADCEKVSEDIYVCNVPQGNSWTDITKFFPDGDMKNFLGTFLYRDMAGDLITYPVECSHVSTVTIGEKTFPAYKYNLPINTFKGLCMSTIVSNTKPSVIAGFHLGGKSGSTLGAAGIVYKNVLLKAISKICDSNPAILEAHSGGDFPTSIYGKKILTDTQIHPKSCINHLPHQTSLKVYGSTIGRATSVSDVISTPISKDIEEVCGVKNEHGPPKFHPWKNFWAGIQKTSKPSMGFDPSELKLAVADYMAPLMDIMKLKMWSKTVKPLTWIETLCGIDSVRFIDAMPKNTSIGFPLSGAKKNYMVALDPNQYPEHACPMDCDECFKEEFEKCKEIYLKGERCYPVFKAALKDEPTKLTKDKVRVFFAAPFVLQCFVRKYFLPICRFLSMNPLVSECAVGINSQGPEWDTLARHMMSKGEDRIFAGDYSSYDTRMAAQVSLASWNIFIHLAKASGNYTEDDITIMKGVATDCCYPVVAYNGDLIEFTGVHISGINLTAYVGSIDNSLMQRCGYFHIAKREKVNPPPYRDMVAVMNYGDDFKGSVAEQADWFNHISYKEFLAAHDVVLTMPDKTSTPTKYMSDKDADFLKRHNIWNEEVQLYFAALDKSSIFKSLHCVLKSGSVTPLQQSAMNIDGALREMFAHGQHDYEILRQQLTEVADRHHIRGQCLMLDQTYEDRMEHFKETYLNQEKRQAQDFTAPSLVMEVQSGIEEDIKEINRQLYATKIENEKKDEKSPKYHGKSDLPNVDREKYMVTRRSPFCDCIAGTPVVWKKDKYIIIPRTKSNFIDLIKNLRIRPCFYQDPIYQNGVLRGDIDLGFPISGGDLMIFEIKQTFTRRNGCSASKQARLNLIYLSQANPNRRIHAFTLRGDKITYVASNCNLTRKQQKMDLFNC